jgi:hypothetical protein
MGIEERIARLERTNRWWRWAAIALAFLLVVNLCCTPSDTGKTASAQSLDPNVIHDKIRAKRIEIVDEKGQLQGSCFTVDGEAKLVLWGENHQGCISVGSSQVELFRMSASQEREWKSAQRAGAAGQQVDLDAAMKALLGTKAVRIGIAELGGGVIDVFNPGGERVVTIQSNKTNEGTVAVCDFNGVPKNVLGVP